MSMLLILIILLIVLGGGGFYAGGPRVGEGLAGLILLIVADFGLYRSSLARLSPRRRPSGRDTANGDSVAIRATSRPATWDWRVAFVRRGQREKARSGLEVGN